MYAIIFEFLNDAAMKLKAKGGIQIGDKIFILNSISNFENVVRTFKDLESYKKALNRNYIYKC